MEQWPLVVLDDGDDDERPPSLHTARCMEEEKTIFEQGPSGITTPSTDSITKIQKNKRERPNTNPGKKPNRHKDNKFYYHIIILASSSSLRRSQRTSKKPHRLDTTDSEVPYHFIVIGCLIHNCFISFELG